MPATDSYPTTLPDFIIGKTRTKADEYLLSDDEALIRPELVTRNDIAHFDVSVICVNGCQNEPLIFENWIYTNPTKPFNKLILNEFGRQQYSAVITKMPNDPTQISTNAWRYDFTICVERILTDKENIDRTLIDRYDLEAPYIDIAINQLWRAS